jgi:hypothetical protein
VVFNDAFEKWEVVEVYGTAESGDRVDHSGSGSWYWRRRKNPVVEINIQAFAGGFVEL